VQSLSGRRIELSVPSASLVDTNSVEVSAWELEGFLDASVTTEGILGADQATCPLPSSASQPAMQMSSWRDDSPHTTSYFTVDDGVQLEILDWGGEGIPLLLMPGLGATAHTFDSLAPQLAQDYRVFALTRRGIGNSSHPESGYDTPALARDVVAVLDAMNVTKAVIVGSSIAGEELSWLGAEYPQRVAGLVYLDAAYDRTGPEITFDENAIPLPPRPPMRPEDQRSYESMLQWMERTASDPVPEGELLALYNISNRFMAGVPAVDMRLLDAIEAQHKRPRYEAITVPVLALYASAESAEYYMKPWYDHDDARIKQMVEEMYKGVTELRQYHIDIFKKLVPAAEIVELAGASHMIYVSREAEVLAQIRSFIARRVETSRSLFELPGQNVTP
jgi:pimeloyl-ACP methyl ester carboxylesterase